MPATDLESKGAGAVSEVRSTCYISCKGDRLWKLKKPVAAWLVSRNTPDPSVFGQLLEKLPSTKYSQNQSQQLLNSFGAFFSMFNLPLTASLD